MTVQQHRQNNNTLISTDLQLYINIDRTPKNTSQLIKPH